MKIEDVMKLVNAGFTADQIAAMAEDPKQAPDPEPHPADDPDPNLGPDPTIADVMQQMKEIREDMRKLAILGTNQKSGKKENVDSILAAIINPQQKEER